MYPSPTYIFTPTEGVFLLIAVLSFGWFTYRFGQLKGLPRWAAPAFFSTKMVAGLAYIAYHARIPDGGDAYHYFHYSHFINDAFRENPHYYFRLLLGANDSFVPTAIYKYAWQTEFWLDSNSYSILRFHSILRWFSGGFYTIHAVFMAFLLYFASRSFYNIFYKNIVNEKDFIDGVFLNKNTIFFEKMKKFLPQFLLIISVFFIPSVWFWTSGIHKDGFIYIALSLVTACFKYFFNDNFEENKENFWKNQFWKGILSGILGMFLILLFRAYLLAAVFPALFLGAWLHFFPKNQNLQYILLILLGLASFYFAIEVLNINFLEKLAWKQREFISERGNLDFEVPHLSATWASLLQNMPISFKNGLFQPILGENSGLVLVFMGAEPVFVVLFSIILLFSQKDTKNTPITYFLLTYCVLNLLLVGLLTANIGTLIRYRSVALGLIPLIILSRRKDKVLNDKC